MKETENLYSVFSKYQLSNPVIGHYCPVCLSKEDNSYFQSTQLRKIEPDAFVRYFSSVGIMDKQQNDFKYFLPRILEIVYNDEDTRSNFYNHVWDRLQEARYTLWKKEEVECLNLFFEEYLKTISPEHYNLTQGILKDIGYNAG